jgi:hypothetical protein
MVLKDLIGKEVIFKGNKCPVLDIAVKNGINHLQLKVTETDDHNDEVWTDIDETRVDVYYTKRPRLFGTLVDAYDGYGKVEWKDADGVMVPFRVDPKTKQLMLDKENRPIMTMKVFDMPLEEISLY